MKPMMQNILTPVMANLMPLFNPADNGAGLWLDAADASTITLATGVSQWDDKSGKGRHATQGNAGEQPTYVIGGLNGKNIVESDGTKWFNVDLDFLAAVDHMFFAVTRTDNYLNIYGAANGSQGNQSLHVGFRNAGSYRVNYWGNDFYPPITANFNAGVHNYMRWTWDDAGNSKAVHANGGLEGQNGSAGTIGTMAGGGRLMNVVGQGIYDGTLAEVIVYPFIPSAALVAQTEAYLAAKWGL